MPALTASASVGSVRVDLAEEMLHQAGRGHVLHLVQHPAALPADPAAAYVEHLHGRLELILGQGDHVAVGTVAEHHRLLLDGALKRSQVISEPGRALELLFSRGLFHLGFQAAGEAGGLPGHEVAEVLGQRAVLLLADPLDARRGALSDVAEQAGPADLAGPLEHARRAGPHREHPEQRVHRVADGPGVAVRAEVPGALALGPAHHHDPRVLLAHGDGEIGVALVVPVLDVEPGVELLDPGVLQLQCLDLGADHGPLDARRRRQHHLGARVQAGEVGEVGVEPLPERLRLADVDHPATLVAEPVDPWGLGNLARRGPVGYGSAGICHEATLRARRPANPPPAGHDGLSWEPSSPRSDGCLCASGG